MKCRIVCSRSKPRVAGVVLGLEGEHSFSVPKQESVETKFAKISVLFEVIHKKPLRMREKHTEKRPILG